ncbi:MAG: ANTAR domain-containing protein [Ruminococcus sp.]|nr:ANTAR domain-containing protein [Ruminococcus sp.]
MTSLIISPNAENLSLIENILKENVSGHIITANSGNEARRIISDDTLPDLVVIDSPLPDEFGQELAVTLSETTSVILICRNDISENISPSLPPEVSVLQKPFTREDFRNAVEMFPEINGVKRESDDILTKIDEMRLINRAKCTLIEYLKFTEPQAHRYIEKQAMNNRQTRKEVAERILSTYKK